MERLADRLEKLDKKVRNWSTETRRKLLFQLASLDLDQKKELLDRLRAAKRSSRIRFSKNKSGNLEAIHEEQLLKSVRSGVRKKQGEIEKVNFSFARQGIFIEHGVGRGRPVRSAKANAFKQPWLSVILPPAIEELADLLAEEYADIAAAELVFRIPGIVDTKVTRK